MATQDTGELVSVETDISTPSCVICNHSISDPNYLYKPPCGHPLHKSCYRKNIKTRPNCSVCGNRISVGTPTGKSNIPSPIVTRSQVRKEISFDSTRPGPSSATTSLPNFESNQQDRMSMSGGSPHDQRDHIRNLITAAVGAQQAEMLTSLSQTLTRLIETNIEAGFRRMQFQAQPTENRNPQSQANFSPINTNPRVSLGQQSLDRLLGLPPANSNNEQADRNDYGSNISTIRPDKIGHIIHNWKIRFSGDSRGMSVDNFLYRVEALTNQTLNGNFDLLCDHISTLFDAKANDCFWRYHHSVPSIRWPQLREAIRKQSKDSRTDIDLREMIRDRKQKQNESFDTFYEAIIDISDRLAEPLSEKILVEILRRNLLPEIQHEILNLKIKSVSELRDICRRREFFLQDVVRKQSMSRNTPFIRKQVHEIEEDSNSDEPDISAISLICWNCHKIGHRYQDCLEDRQVFCYDCGLPNVYKPKCVQCNSKNSKLSAPKSALRQNQATRTD